MGVRKHPDKSEPNACSDTALTAIQRAPSALFWPTERIATPFCHQKSPFEKRMCLQQSPLLMRKPHWRLDKWKLPLVKALLLSESLIRWISICLPLNPDRHTQLTLNLLSQTLDFNSDSWRYTWLSLRSFLWVQVVDNSICPLLSSFRIYIILSYIVASYRQKSFSIPWGHGLYSLSLPLEPITVPGM